MAMLSARVPRSPPSKKLRSDVWEHMVKVTVEGEVKARCLLCNPNKDFSYCGGTSNLREHLENKHPTIYKRDTGTSQASILEYTSRSSCSKARSNEITGLIADMVAFDMRPMRIVEGEGFLKLMKFLEPSYKVPSAMHISTLVHHKHKSAQEKLKDMLANEASNIALTDIWTSITSEAYITVTAHFISRDWSMVSAVLGTCAFPERHTGQEISCKVIKLVESYGIAEKIKCIVHDQGSNMVLCMRILSDDKGWCGLRCAAHCLQLCINAAISSVRTVEHMIGAAKKLVGHFKHSVVATEALKNRQSQMGIDKKKLIQSCATRWNSCYEMLLRLLEMRWPVSAVLSDETVTKRSDRSLDLTGDQWSIAEEIVKILKPFTVATTFLQAEHNASISCILPIIHGLNVSLQPSEPTASEDSVAAQQFKSIIRQELRSRWSLDDLDVTSIDVLGSALDPRFRQMKFLDDDKKKEVKDEIKNMITSIPEISTSQSRPQDNEGTSALDILLGPEELSVNDYNLELEAYFTEKPLPRDTNPLLWWKDNARHFNSLAKITKSLLCTPSTSAPAECVFSNAGLTINRLRSSLNPDTVDALIFLNKNHSLLK